MDVSISTSLIAAASAVALAGASYWFTKKQEREAELRKEKLAHYKDYAAALSGVISRESTPETQRAYSRACNALNLIAPQRVLEALQKFQNMTGNRSGETSLDAHDAHMSALFLEMRRDLGITPRDEQETFRVRLWASGQPPDARSPMTALHPPVALAPRDSNFVSTETLLTMLEQQSVSRFGPRKWSLASEGGLGFPIPIPAPRYLFRGQTQRRTPCLPSQYRHYKYQARYLAQLEAEDAAHIVANFARMFMFITEMRHHPVSKWTKTQGYALPFSEIAQHHGIATPHIDLSESIEVALFFATHEYNEGRGFTPRTDGRGVLYIVDMYELPPPYRERFRSVAIQPFSRPYMQWAWSSELLMGECLEACPRLAILEFDHSAALASAARERAEVRGSLCPPDVLAMLAGAISSMTILPTSAIAAAREHLGPAYPERIFGTPETLLRNAGYGVWTRPEPILSPAAWKDFAPAINAALHAWIEETTPHMEHIAVRQNKAGEAVAIARFNRSIDAPDSFEVIRQIMPIYTG